jgi:hypothetical protein
MRSKTTMPDPSGTTPGKTERNGPAGSHLRFETLITDIAARFLSGVPRVVDAKIDRALRDVPEFFGSNLCGLFRICPSEKSAILSHLKATNDIPVMPEMFDCWLGSPFMAAKAARGEIVLMKWHEW